MHERAYKAVSANIDTREKNEHACVSMCANIHNAESASACVKSVTMERTHRGVAQLFAAF